MRKVFWYLIIICICLLCCSCTVSEPNYGEIPDYSCEYAKVERIYESNRYIIEKVTVNDTLVKYIMTNRRGIIKLN